jgi:hypothetical protein
MKYLIALCFSLAITANAENPRTLLKSVQGELRYMHFADLSALGDEETYVLISGGFGGGFFEFVDMKNKDRVSLTDGYAEEGGSVYRKRILFSYYPTYRDARIEALRAAVKDLIMAKLPPDVPHVSGDDSTVILVAEKRKGKLHYWAREDTDKSLEKAFLNIMEKADLTEKLLDPPPSDQHKGAPKKS